MLEIIILSYIEDFISHRQFAHLCFSLLIDIILFLLDMVLILEKNIIFLNLPFLLDTYK